MVANMPSQVDAAKLPNLAPRIITVVLLICLVLLIGQTIKDRSEQQELIEYKELSLYYQQHELIGRLNNVAMRISVNDNEAAIDDAQALLRTLINQLKQTQDELLSLTLQKKRLYFSYYSAPEKEAVYSAPEKAAVLSQEIDHILLYTNEVLADAERNEGHQRLIELSQKIFLAYQNFDNEVLHYITNLTSDLLEKNEKNRRFNWWATLFTIIMVLIVSIGIYWRGKKLVHQQFNALKKMKEQLEVESNKARENEQKAIEQFEESRNQRAKLNAILDSAVDAIISISGDGIIDSYNRAAEMMFGYPADLVIGKNINMLMPEPYSSEHDSYLEHYRKTGAKKVIGHIREVFGRRVDGSEFPLRLAVSEVIGIEPKLFTGIIRDITERREMETELQSTLAKLTEKQVELEEEERIASHVFETITASNNDLIPEISSWCEPMGAFSGDMILSAKLPAGGIRIILCDFTGHGLPAALGAVPVSMIHSAMAKKGLPLEILMDELNNKLNELLPTGIFCCIAGIDLNKSRTKVKIWNAGLPEVLVVNQRGEIIERVASNHLPLGVRTYDKGELDCQELKLTKGDSVYALSDGLTEAENEAGELFGQQRFEQLLMCEIDGHGRLDQIRNSVGKFIGNAAATDDISLIEIKTVSTIS